MRVAPQSKRFVRAKVRVAEWFSTPGNSSGARGLPRVQWLERGWGEKGRRGPRLKFKEAAYLRQRIPGAPS